MNVYRWNTLLVQRSPEMSVVDRIKCFLEVNGRHPQRQVELSQFFVQERDCEQVIVASKSRSEAGLIDRLL
eukprot:9956655-Karenia_brevis.AAC.1